jgi:hypothetical protein
LSAWNHKKYTSSTFFVENPYHVIPAKKNPGDPESGEVVARHRTKDRAARAPGIRRGINYPRIKV